MIVPYVLRLLFLCLATFFLVHLALGLATFLLTPAAMAIAERMRPRPAARLLLGLRLFPAGFALFMVAGLCAPSYLWLEPKATAESMGLACLAAAVLGAAVWASSIVRGLRAASRSLRHLQQFRRMSRTMQVPGESSPVWVLEGMAPLVMLAGIVHPRLMISRQVMAALSAEQLAAVLGHERAHQRSHDNFKRLLVLLAPGMLPFFGGFGALERGWARITEWAADDHAAAGDSQRSLTLAAALVRVARLGTVSSPPLATSLMADGLDLSARVDRLLRPAPAAAGKGPGARLLLASATFLLGGSLLAVMVQPATLSTAHEFLEQFIR